MRVPPPTGVMVESRKMGFLDETRSVRACRCEEEPLRVRRHGGNGQELLYRNAWCACSHGRLVRALSSC